MVPTELCPKCETRGVSSWARALAVWPFSTRCRNCGARLRVQIPYWQNVTVQLLSQVVFWTVLIVGIRSGIGVAAAFLGGAALSIVIAIVPGRFAKLEVIKN